MTIYAERLLKIEIDAVNVGMGCIKPVHLFESDGYRSQ